VRLLRIKSRYRISNTAFNEILKLLSSAFSDSKLPSTNDDANKYLRELDLGYDKIHVCQNNCVLFRKTYANMDACPKCKQSRWEDEDGKCVPRKVLRHFPLIPMFKRMFGSSQTANDLQWHRTRRVPVEGQTSHPADGKPWKHFDDKYNWFAKDPRNLRLAKAIDGFNPFGNFSTTYSMWPVLVMPLHLHVFTDPRSKISKKIF